MIKLPNAEQIANQLLKRANQTSPSVNLACLTSLWDDLSLGFDDIKHDGYFINLGGFGKEIIIRSNSLPTRQRFTIAHEIGHLILEEHDIKFDKQVLFERSSKYDVVERWCDTFAANLLMPKDWIIDDLRKSKIDGIFENILRMPELYDVSVSAFRKRISEITPVSIFELKQSKKSLFVERFIKSSYESKSVGKFRLKKTLDNLIEKIEYSVKPVQSINHETKMISIYKLTSNENDLPIWTMCVFPQYKTLKHSQT